MSDICTNTSYGFQWEQVEVTRIAEFNGTRCVEVNGVNVYVSPKGRSVRVFRNGKEMTT